MQQYIVSSDSSTGRMTEFSPNRAGTGLMPKIVVASALVKAALVGTLLTASSCSVACLFKHCLSGSGQDDIQIPRTQRYM